MTTDAIELHSREAELFDSRYHTAKDFQERLHLWNQLIIRYSTPQSQVLDVGCGSGVFSFSAAGLNQSVVGIDGSREMVELCQRKKLANQISNVSFINSRLEHLPQLSLATADLVLCSSVLEYVDDLYHALDVFRRQLKPGGVMLVSLPNMASYYRKLERCAFRVTGRPAYLGCVRNVVTLAEFNHLATILGFDCLESHYYGNKWSTLRVVARRFSAVRFNNLFAGVYRKSRA